MIFDVEFIENDSVFDVDFGTIYNLSEGDVKAYEERIETLEKEKSEKYEEGYEDGKNSVVDIGRYANTIQLASLNCFGTPKATINLDKATNLYMLCAIQGQASENVNTTVEHLTINCPNLVTDTSAIIYGNGYNPDNKLKRVTLNVDTQKSTKFSSMFQNTKVLEVIDGLPINFSSCTQGSITAFQDCQKLIAFVVVKNSIHKNFLINYCPNLSAETIQSIIDGLADLTGQTAQKVTWHTDIILRLTEEQVSQITNKNWDIG